MYNLTKVHELTHVYRINTIKRIINHSAKRLSTKVAIKTDQIDSQLIKDVEKITNITSKEIKKKPQKPPFAKNLFLGIFDTDILTYPEVLEKEDVEKLDRDIRPIKDFFCEESSERKITKNYLENLNRLKLIGLQAPTIADGRQLSITEACRFKEVIAEDTSRTSVIESEQLGVQTLLKIGNSQQQNTYLQDLINGRTVSAFCVSEVKTSDPRYLQTKAILSNDKKTWVLNGTKTWIVNGDTADLFIVLAETEVLSARGLKDVKTTAFLVERSFGGVTSKFRDCIGLNCTDISDVTFHNTPVPAENVLGDVNAGENVIMSILPEFRLSSGPICGTLLRKLIKKFSEHCIETEGGNLTTTEAVRYKIGQMTASLYAIESITYLTAALSDQYENQDCELETAIVKVFSAEHCHSGVLNAMDFIGAPTFMADNWCNQLYRDSLGHLLLNESADSLKLIVSLLGLQHAGIQLQDTIKMIRNPLYHPAAMFKRIWTQQRHIDDNPKLSLRLSDYLHPSAINPSKLLEYSVLRLQYATETLLAQNGPDVISKHIDLRRLADCVIDIYAMTAVLGRASRSYCIGLQYADFEMDIANAFCVTAMERVKNNVQKISSGPYNAADDKYTKIAKQIIKSKEYFPVHPLTRNF